MGVGHFAASFAVRGRFPRVPLFWLLAAGVFVDVLWGIAILSGVERAHVGTENGSAVPIVLDHVPYTHSLVAGLLWGALVALAWWAWRKDGAGALLVGALVASHWVLDFASHVAEMPVLPSGPLVGLGLWRWRGASLVVELAMIWIGLALYARFTTGKDRVGSIGLFVVAAVLTILCAGTYLGPPAPSIAPLAIGNLVLILPLLLIDWVDRHRETAIALH